MEATLRIAEAISKSPVAKANAEVAPNAPMLNDTFLKSSCVSDSLFAQKQAKIINPENQAKSSTATCFYLNEIYSTLRDCKKLTYY